MPKRLYLANPYGFSAQQRSGALAALVEALEAAGAEVWEPFARNNPVDKTAPGWAYRVGQADLRDVRTADGLFAVVNGCPPDEGVMVELGLAIAWGKPTFLFRDCSPGFQRAGGSPTGTARSKRSPIRTRRWRGGFWTGRIQAHAARQGPDGNGNHAEGRAAGVRRRPFPSC